MPFTTVPVTARALARAGLVALVALSLTAAPAGAQDRGANGRARNPGLPGWCETPAADRKAEEGCYTTAITDVGVPPAGAIYWHLDVFPTRIAAEASRGPHSTVVESHHKQWLFTIADGAWRPNAGERIAMIGPLVVDPAVPYTAHYLETVIPPGFQDGKGNGHRHPGPEAWYVLEGGQCLETPNGVMTGFAGDAMLAPEGWPMAISSAGTDTRRAVVLILHRSSEPYAMPVGAHEDAPHAHWVPKGLCSR
jgi:hypothetical protein